nr:immunoglobulin light chain junction region [Macaca mulatta]MOW70403.1 immunoglobulin light chain junction region [Macaca mulatta]MOW71148.1 immunoglobulin light chain junction region [Macaca mulatta]
VYYCSSYAGYNTVLF